MPRGVASAAPHGSRTGRRPAGRRALRLTRVTRARASARRSLGCRTAPLTLRIGGTSNFGAPRGAAPSRGRVEREGSRRWRPPAPLVSPCSAGRRFCEPPRFLHGPSPGRAQGIAYGALPRLTCARASARRSLGCRAALLVRRSEVRMELLAAQRRVVSAGMTVDARRPTSPPGPSAGYRRRSDADPYARPGRERDTADARTPTPTPGRYSGANGASVLQVSNPGRNALTS